MITLRASKSGRWIPCPASATQEQITPSEPNEAAREGTAAHYVLEYILKTPNAVDLTGTVAPNDVIITREMVMHVCDCINWIYNNYDVANNPTVIEHQGKIKTPRGNVVLGRCDIGHYNLAQFKLTIFDFKYGWGIIHPLNSQLLIYSYAIALFLVSLGYEWPQEIELVIMQPRPSHNDGPFRRVSINFEEWKRKIAEIQLAADTAHNSPDHYSPGSHCHDCTAATRCVALRESGYNIIDEYVGKPIETNLTAQQLAAEMELVRRAEKILTERREALEHIMTARIKSGEYVPGWTVQPSYARAEWIDPELGIRIGTLFGIETSKTVPITPHQAKQKGVPKELVNSLTKSRMTGMKLKSEDASERARKAFKNAR